LRPAPEDFSGFNEGNIVFLQWNPADIPYDVHEYIVYANGTEVGSTTDTMIHFFNVPAGYYDYYVQARYSLGMSPASEIVQIHVDVSNQEHSSPQLPAPSTEIYPNPIRCTAFIQVKLPASTTVNLDLYDLRGRKIGSVFQGKLPSGENRLDWDSARIPNLSTGVYLLKSAIGDFVSTKKVLIVK
ncbi:MAG: T9SS type A sorting domain-containing protein, partial [Candidatus Cloacimonadaceae bacterium]|nr:T9SS type A sorting domain-containing protein [Candidatus Cloacimonadaceae bacterium]